MTPWFYLSAAIGLEIIATFLLKLSHGFENTRWGVLSILCYGACFWVLAPALRDLPVGVVYAIWSGVGIIGAVGLGLLVFDERLSGLQLLAIAMIAVGAVLLKVISPD